MTMTDCHPAYLNDALNLSRTHVTPKNYGEARSDRGPERSQWAKSMKDELKPLKQQRMCTFVDEL